MSHFPEHLNDLEREWLQSIFRWYPDLHSKTYFVPPVFFNRVPYYTKQIANRDVLVSYPVVENSRIPDVTTFIKVPKSHVREDLAQQHLLMCLRALAKDLQGNMMVLFQLPFGKYLKNVSGGIIDQIPKVQDLPPKLHLGDFDLLIVHRRYGLITGEIKCVGDNFAERHVSAPDADAEIARKVVQAARQLVKSKQVLQHLVSDIPGIAVSGTMIMPNVTSEQLEQVLGSTETDGEALCHALDATEIAEVIGICLCKDQLSDSATPSDISVEVKSKLCCWWNRLVGRVSEMHMTATQYEKLISRFCGPATQIDIHCITSPRLEVRTEWDGISETGERMTRLALYPNQVDLLEETTPRVFLTGPPGTGKTIVLMLKSLKWIMEGRDVHVVCTWYKSPASSFILEDQIRKTFALWNNDAVNIRVGVRRHQFDFEKGDVETAIETLASFASQEGLCVIADEAGPEKGNKFSIFCEGLLGKVSKLALWAAAIDFQLRPSCLAERKLTVPLRSPPVVVREVSRSNQIQTKQVYEYTGNGIPSPTDGPEVKRLRHAGQAGHSEVRPRDCVECGHNIADILERLNLNENGADGRPRPPPFQYRDVLILCEEPQEEEKDRNGVMTSPASGLVRGLRDRKLPVLVVGREATDDTVRDMALGVRNEITVTHWSKVHGLERKVVIEAVYDFNANQYSRLYDLSRSSSLLVLVDIPEESEHS